MAEVDIATLGIKVDASDADKAGNKLEQLAGKAEQAESATRGVTSATATFKSAISQTMGAINGNASALNSLSQSGDKAATSTRKASTATEEMADRMIKLLNSIQPYEAAQHQANAELAEARVLFQAGYISAEQFGIAQSVLGERAEFYARKQELANMAALKGKAAMGLATHEMVNMGRQFADVGTMLAMGSSPFMILATQGPQIADILAIARQRGVSAGDAFAQMGKSIAPIALRLAPIGIAAGVAFGALALSARGASEGLTNVQKELHLSEQQMKKLKDSGTELGFTMSDVASGIVSAFAYAFGFDDVKKAWNKFLDYLGTEALSGVEDVVGKFTGGINVIKVAFQNLPQSVGAAMVALLNMVINAINDMAERGTRVLNNFLGLIPQALKDFAHIPDSVAAPGRIANVANPYQGQLDKLGSAYEEGRAGGIAAMRSGMASHRASRITEAAGDGDTGGNQRDRRAKPATNEAAEDAKRFIDQLRQETAEIGKNRIELKMMAAERAAAAAPTQKLKDDIRASAEAWRVATEAQANSDFKRTLKDEADELRFETSLIGLNTAAREAAIVAHGIELKIRDAERDGIKINRDAIAEETAALLANAHARGQRDMNVENAQRYATAMADVAANVREATDGFGELFGAAGEGMANMVNVMAEFAASQADSYAKLAELQRDYQAGNIDIAQYEFERQRAAEQSANAQVAYYGNLIGAAKSFFHEGSTGFKALEAAERAYRLFQFAMQVRAMLMDKASTVSSVANSGARAAADGVAAVAKAIASLPFPLNLAAGAATLAFLVAIGVKMFGGGGKGSTASASAATASKASDIYNGPRDEYGNPTSYYSVLRPGGTTVANDNGGGRYGGSASGSTVVIHGDTLNINGGADERTVDQLHAMLDERDKKLTEDVRQTVARDTAERNARYSIGG